MHVGLQHVVDAHDQPRAGDDAALLLRQRLPRPPGAAPIGFTTRPATSRADATAAAQADDDPVNAESDDAARFNNANFGTPPDGSPPRMQMYLFEPNSACRSRRQRRRRRRRSSTTSTRTACRTAWSPTRTGGGPQRRPVRRDGRGLERLVRAGLPRRARASTTDTGRRRRGEHGRYVDGDAHAASARSRSTARSARRGRGCPGGAAAPGAGRLHARRPRPVASARRLRGPRRRRDLGADAVGSAQGARLRRVAARARHRRRCACRRPARRSSTSATRSCRPTRSTGGDAHHADLAGVRRPRDGLRRGDASANATTRRRRSTSPALLKHESMTLTDPAPGRGRGRRRPSRARPCGSSRRCATSTRSP